MAEAVSTYTGFDFYKVFETFVTPKQARVRDAVREYVVQEVLPNINPYWERGEFPTEIAMKLADIDPPIVGGLIEGRGCPGLDPLELGMVAYELERGDGSVGTFYGVQTGLAMPAIAFLGSDEQRDRWLPGMAKLEKIGAFALTEPDRGSAATDVQTTARRDGDYYILNGHKRWIGNASIADVIVVWARDEDTGDFGGYVIENPDEVEGLDIEVMGGKISKRSVLNADFTMDDVAVPVENRLPKVKTFKDAGKVLLLGRVGVAWGAAGLAVGIFEHALEYAQNRHQFGSPIASYQLIQRKLVEMASEITSMQLICLQLANLTGQRALTPGIASMAKYNNARKARRVAALGREILGGNGILLENHVARLFLDAESVYTYEGTNEMNMLIAGREITGHSAFV